MANVYPHHVLDQWFATEVRPRLSGRCFMVRYADDVVIVTGRERDARRVMDVLPKRLARFGLTMHATKTRLVDFRSPRGPRDDDSGPGTFDFLGFTHYWGRTRQGGWAIKRKTAKDRFRRSLRALYVWCRFHRHRPIAEQHRTLVRKLAGHGNYYGIRGNSRALQVFRYRGPARLAEMAQRAIAEAVDAPQALLATAGPLPGPSAPFERLNHPTSHA